MKYMRGSHITVYYEGKLYMKFFWSKLNITTPDLVNVTTLSILYNKNITACYPGCISNTNFSWRSYTTAVNPAQSCLQANRIHCQDQGHERSNSFYRNRNQRVSQYIYLFGTHFFKYCTYQVNIACHDYRTTIN